ncbi:hypothetical protein BDR04DRAFT_1123041 [Suillus decipiens]|nr:hypothetical protein BDR04DRAFT_1123041 [Suillus decipiens]
MPLTAGQEAFAATPRRSARMTQQVTTAQDKPAIKNPYGMGVDIMINVAMQRDGGLARTKDSPRMLIAPARPATRPAWGSVATAETGRPESSADFARRVKDHFVLLGPGERKKGGTRENSPHSEQKAQTKQLNTGTTSEDGLTEAPLMGT